MSDTSYDTPLFSLHRLPGGRLRCGPILLFFSFPPFASVQYVMITVDDDPFPSHVSLFIFLLLHDLKCSVACFTILGFCRGREGKKGGFIIL